MDIEQLKLILETVSDVSGDAVAVAIGYLFVANVLPFIGWMIAGFGAYKIAKDLVQRIGLTSDEEFFKEMRDLLKIGCPGLLSDQEKRQIKSRLMKIACDKST